jgi:aminoglycoside 3-N-acetyltransferase
MLSVTRDDIMRACEKAGLAGSVVCVHAALRSFGWVAGGGASVVDGLLASGCTVLAPTFSWGAYAVAPPRHLRPPRNGWEYGALTRRALLGIGSERVFTPDSMVIDAEMGAVPTAVLAQAERVRGEHPLCSFSAVGPAASNLIEDQRADDVFAPLFALAEIGGFVALMGVGLNRMTMIHAAEKRAGRELFRRWALHADGEVGLFEVGGCSEGFEQLAPALATMETRITVGRSVWRIFPAQAALEAAAALMASQPEITRCGDPLCNRCRDAIAGGPVLVGGN